MTDHCGLNTDDAFYARDRIEALEGIVGHYTRHVNLDKATAVQIARSLRHKRQRADGRDQPLVKCPSAYANSDSVDEEEEFTIEHVNYTATGERLFLMNLQFNPLI